MLGALIFLSCRLRKERICHANAKHLKSCPTEAPQSHSYHPQFPRVRGKSPSDPLHAGERKGAVMLSNCVECQGVLGDKLGFHG